MRLGLIGLAFVATACASGGASGSGGFQQPAADADYGVEPNVEEEAKAHFELTLKDPASAQFRIGYVGKAYCNKGYMLGGDVIWTGYAANIYVNAKNSYGGYTGFQPYTLLWRDGAIFKRFDNDDFGNAPWGSTNLCRWENGQTEMAGQ
ncbi:hypothetical protein ACQKH5_01650 [Hyphomonas sp. NPDC076900]|uniref:hypothetical protein n=1 Tax=unclassified Hyphomonas TaxID=2630699 RepID=UPI003D000DD7